jgi:HEAT repeat protein
VIGVVKDASRTDSVRAACAYAIGARRNAAGTPALLAALDDNRGDTQRLAAWALGQLGEPKALGPLVRAYFSRAGGGGDELTWAIGRTSGAGLAPSPLADLGDYPMRSTKFNDTEAVRVLPGALPHGPVAARLVIDHVADISAGLTEALGEHRDVVVSVLSDLDAAPDRLALGALTPATGDAKVTAALAKISTAIEPKVTAQLGSDDPKVRALAVSVLAKMGSDAAIGKALADPADQVRAAAMQAIPVIAKLRGGAPAPLVAALVKVAGAPGWADRRAAVLALGKLGTPEAVAALVKAAGDSSSFVREAVATALGEAGTGRATLEALAKDEVLQVREAATRSLGAAKP